jgi:hypothetical protein
MPSVEKLNLKDLNKSAPNATDQRKNKSLFALNLERQGKLKSHFALSQVFQVESLKQDEQIKQIENHLASSGEKKAAAERTKTGKQIITGEGLGNRKDVEQIHFENLEFLSRMKPEEIVAEQQKLLQQLDPKIVAFIRRKNKKAAEETNGDAQHNMDVSDAPAKNYTNEEFIEQLPIKPNKNWLHMDKIEYDKLEWMVVKPRTAVKIDPNDQSAPSQARFDFEGNLIAPGQNVPVTRALHHHGNEPDQAGYTLDELFHLARSKFNQQKVLAIQTIGNILAKCHAGVYQDIIKSGGAQSSNADESEELDEYQNSKNNLLNQLVDGGVLFLLRVSLDDQTESIINAALTALNNLVQPSGQEDKLDLMYDMNQSIVMPSLHPFSAIFDEEKSRLSVDKNINVSERKELYELKDDEFIRHDLVRGLLRMNLVERFHYLLDKYRPSLSLDQVLNNVFSILFRCMRHSADFGVNFYETYPQLFNLIGNTFLPSTALDMNDAVVYLKIDSIRNTLKLIRLISCSGPSLAYKIHQKFDLKQKLLTYLTCELNTSDPRLRSHILIMKTEALRLLKVYVSYSSDGNGQYGINTLIDLFEVLLKQLNGTIQAKLINDKQYFYSLITLFNSLMLKSRNLTAQNELICFNITSSVYSILSKFLTDRFRACLSDETELFADIKLLSLATNFVVDYLENSGRISADLNFIDKKMKSIEGFVEQIFKPILDEKNKMNQLRFDSLFMSKLTAASIYSADSRHQTLFKKIYTNNLSYLPTILSLNENTSEESVFSFLASFLRLYLVVFKLRMKQMDNERFGLTRGFLNNAYLKSYLKLFAQSSQQGVDSANTCYFNTQAECHFVYHVLKLQFYIFNFEVCVNFMKKSYDNK